MQKYLVIVAGAALFGCQHMPPADKAPAAVVQTAAADASAVPAATSKGSLGKVVASLGDAGSPGLWMRTSLVQAKTAGTVRNAAGKSVNVDLIPGSGSGQLSMAAYQALGFDLTDLPEVEVLAR